MEVHELICIQCPMGCPLTVTVEGDQVTVTGNTCPRGAVYGKKEVTHPTRTVTSTIEVEGGELPRVSVKTAGEVPKERIFAVMVAIRAAKVAAPVAIGDVIVKSAADTGVDVIATKPVKKA